MTSDLCGIATTFVDPNTLLVELHGNWQVREPLDRTEVFLRSLQQAADIRTIAFDTRKMVLWNSGLLTFLLNLHSRCRERGIQMDSSGLPQGVKRLLSLALAVPQGGPSSGVPVASPFLEKVGAWAVNYVHAGTEAVDFLGQVFLSCLKTCNGSARFRVSDLLLFIQHCGPQALPIITLISLLVGLILAFVGTVQLQMFGAQIYVANLVGLAMSREMGAMMAAIIMAGRTGAAFAAQLGSMTVSEEIDAFRTMGIKPVEFLVLPRILALVLMMPLLCLYADCMGIIGGAVVGIGMLDISPIEYYNQTRISLSMVHFAVGIGKSMVFGILVAMAGCLRGIQCKRSSSAVGDAATSAVVTAIVFIIVADAVMTYILTIMGI